MEDNREALGTLSDTFKKEFLTLYKSLRACQLLHPVEPEDPDDIPLILHRPKSAKNEAVSISLDRKNINFRDYDGNTLLHLAVMNYNSKRSKNQLKIIRAILNAKNSIDPNVRNEDRQTPLDIAISIDPINLDLIDALIKPVKNNINQVDGSPETLKILLRLAIMQDRPYTVKYLLKLGADPRATDEQGKTALHHAVENLDINPKILKHLENFMKDNYQGFENMKGATLLHIVALEGIEGVTEQLINEYDINAEMNNGLRPIVLALKNPKVLKEFVNAGAQAHWTAYQKRKPNKQEMKGMKKLLEEIKQEKENVEFKLNNKDPAVQNALFNLIAYTGKLKSELDNATFITNTYHLPEKYDSLKKLIAQLLTETDPQKFNTKISAALKDNTLTENRAKLFGFYKLHGLFSKKRVSDNPHQKHYVRSTTEELLYDLKKAVDDALVNPKAAPPAREL